MGDYGATKTDEEDPLVANGHPTHTITSAPSLRAKFMAELIGTCVLVQVGTGSNCVALFLQDTQGMWQIAVVWILAAALGIYASAATSGGHLNPAVTLAMAVARRGGDIAWSEVAVYWIAQVLGGAIAAAFNLGIFYVAVAEFEASSGIDRGQADGIQSAAAFSDYYSLSEFTANAVHATFLEAFGTAFLCFVVFMATNPKSKVPGGAMPVLVAVAIGSMVSILGPFTNAGINPARDMGPRLTLAVAGWGTAAFTNWIPYVVGPLIGGPIGGFVADAVLMA